MVIEGKDYEDLKQAVVRLEFPGLRLALGQSFLKKYLSRVYRSSAPLAARLSIFCLLIISRKSRAGILLFGDWKENMEKKK